MCDVKITTEYNTFMSLEFRDKILKCLIPYLSVIKTSEFILRIGNVYADKIKFLIFSNQCPSFLVMFVYAESFLYRKRFFFGINCRTAVSFLFSTRIILVITGEIELEIPVRKLCFLKTQNIR